MSQDELSSLSDRLSALEEEEEERKRSLSLYDHTETPRLVADPLRLKELLDICTVVNRGPQLSYDDGNEVTLSVPCKKKNVFVIIPPGECD